MTAQPARQLVPTAPTKAEEHAERVLATGSDPTASDASAEAATRASHRPREGGEGGQAPHFLAC